MSTDPSTTEQIAAAVLAEHVQRVNQCTCGWAANMTGRVYMLHHLDEAHRAHVAQQIAARLDDGLRAGIEAVISDRASGDFTPILPKLRALLDQTRTEADR